MYYLIHIDLDFIGLYIAMMLYPVLCFIEFTYTIIQGLYWWAKNQKNNYQQ